MQGPPCCGHLHYCSQTIWTHDKRSLYGGTIMRADPFRAPPPAMPAPLRASTAEGMAASPYRVPLAASATPPGASPPAPCPRVPTFPRRTIALCLRVQVQGMHRRGGA
eukprot:1149501-Pelagomonas_calceolata.AAC.2